MFSTARAKKMVWRASDLLFATIAARHLKPREPLAPSAGTHYVVPLVSGIGSLGDEAMAVAVTNRLRDADPEAKITVVCHHDVDLAAVPNMGVAYDDVFSLEGYFAPMPGARRIGALADLLRSATHLVLVGADVMDGRYSDSRSYRRWRLAIAGRDLGLRTAVIGFSFSDRATPRVMRYLRRNGDALNLCCREPVSAGRLSSLLRRDVGSAADLAFLLPPQALRSDGAVKAANFADSSRPTVVVNINSLSFAQSSAAFDSEVIRGAYVPLLQRLHAATGCAFLLLPHDIRPRASDVTQLHILDRLLGDTVPTHVVVDRITAGEVKHLCGSAQLVLTGRMHLGIAALGAGVPALFFDYQGKVQGLLHLIDKPEWSYSADDLRYPEVFARRMATMLTAHDALTADLQERVPAIRSLATRNLEFILGATDAS